MIHEEICTYEVCKVAKEKGFNVPTDRYYHIYDDVIEAQNSLEMTSDGCADFYNSLNQCRCAAPTQSLLQRWLREEKNIVVEIGWFSMEQKYYWSVFDTTKDDMFASFIPPAKSMSRYDTWEQALECGLKYALKELK